MTLKEIGLSDEEVQDIIASLVASDANINWTYDDANNNLTASLDNSVSVSTLEADSYTDAQANTVTDFSALGGTVKYSQNSEPSNPSAEEMWYDTSVGILRIYDGSRWVASETIRTVQEAVTFSEQDISLSGDAFVSNQSVRLTLKSDILQRDSTNGYQATVGDFDNDGVDEVAYINSNTNIVNVYDGVDDKITELGIGAYDLISGDVDGDGVPELIVRATPDYYTSSNLRVFDVETNTDLGGKGSTDGRIFTADIDDDGVQEIVYRSDGSSDYLNVVDVESNTYYDTGQDVGNFVAVGDFTGDGKEEILFTNAAQDDAFIWEVENNNISSSVYTGIQGLFAGDIDGDGVDEPIFPHDQGITILQDYDVGASFTTQVYNDSNFHSELAIGDIDGDSADEIVGGNGSGVLWVYDDTDGIYEPSRGVNNPPVLGDFDTDSAKEVMYENNSGDVVLFDYVDKSFTNINVTNSRTFGAVSGDTTGNGIDSLFITDGAVQELIPEVATSSGTSILDFGEVPDFQAYDAVTYQAEEPSSGTDTSSVTADVVDGNGNVLISDIPPNVDIDISDIDTSKNPRLRFNLSRDTLSLEPAVNYAAQSYFR